jgi:UDP-N-acetylmuramoyl-tripeptide--D-alanyl-D-alanine ligase
MPPPSPDHPAMAAIDIMHCVGPLDGDPVAALPKRQRGEWHATATTLPHAPIIWCDAGDVVLVKGSKGIKVSAGG